MKQCKMMSGMMMMLLLVGFSAEAQMRMIPHVTRANGGFVAFDGSTFPANLFGPGSDAFVGVVGIESNTPTVLQVDGLIATSGTTTVPVEIVSLDLVSSQPITVTYNGGQNPETWMMGIGLSQLNSPVGEFAYTGDGTGGGGMFTGHLLVQPRFIFTPFGTTTGNAFDVDSAGVLNPIQFNLSAPNPGPFGMALGYDGVAGIAPGSGDVVPLTFATGDGSGSITLEVVVPEPSALGVMLLLMGGAMFKRRRLV